MLDGLLGRGFAAKCKSLIKMIKTRIDVIRRKRNATQKFLKKDIADLLANGLDINAYGRAEGLLAELDLSSCYDYVEKTCDFISKHLLVMQKQSQCPEECREAASSIMFAAARFSDLPELRELRQIFQEKYGNSLDYYANKEFVERLCSKPSTMERRIKLIQDIASEFSISWDARAFALRMSKPSAQDQPKTNGSLHYIDSKPLSLSGKGSVSKAEKHDVLSIERLGYSDDRHGLHNGSDMNVSKRNEPVLQRRLEMSTNGYKPDNGREEAKFKKDDSAIAIEGRREFAFGKHGKWNENESITPEGVKLVSSFKERRLEYVDGGNKPRSERDPGELNNSADSWSRTKLKSDAKDNAISGNNDAGQHSTTNSTRKVQEDERDKLKPNGVIPPPYVKPNIKGKDHKYGANIEPGPAGFDDSGISKDILVGHRSRGGRLEEVQLGTKHADDERQLVKSLTVDSNGDEKDYRHQDEAGEPPLPKPRLHRRRHLKSRPSHDAVGNSEDTEVTRKLRSRRREESRRGLQQILFDEGRREKDEEERIIDKLLIHYSKKPSTYGAETARRKSRTRPVHNFDAEAGESQHSRSRDRPHEGSEAVCSPPVRSVSLPPEPFVPSDAKKVYSRAASFQPDGSNSARHVHPKLPDYDDLAARFAALKGR